MRRALFLAVPFTLVLALTASQLISQETPAKPVPKDTNAKDAAVGTETLPPGAERTASGKIIYRGRLPNGWGKLGILADQKQKIYKVQAEYNAKIDELERQIAEVKAQRDAAMRAELTDEQRAALDESLAEKKTQ